MKRMCVWVGSGEALSPTVRSSKKKLKWDLEILKPVGVSLLAYFTLFSFYKKIKRVFKTSLKLYFPFFGRFGHNFKFTEKLLE